MATVFVDLVNLDGSRPEGRLKFSLEQLRIGDPDVVPSSVEVAILDGKARVEDLLPGEMKVQVSTGRWSKEWQVAIPDNGTHDLFDLLGTSAPEFEHALWATLLDRVEALEKAPAVDLAPLENRVTALEQKPVPQPFDPSELEAENAALKTQVEQLQAALDAFPPAKPVGLTSLREFDWDLVDPLYEIGGTISSTIWMGRVDLAITVPVNEDSQRVLKDGVYFAGVPAPANVPVSRTMTAIGQDGTVKDITRAGLRAEFVSGKIRFYDRGSAPGGVFGEAITRGDTSIRIQFVYYTEDKY